MSESVREDVSTESLCTVIENSSTNSHIQHSPNYYTDSETIDCLEDTESEICDSSANLQSTDVESSCDANLDFSKPRLKLKKSVSFDPNDEKVRKFTTGEPIVDQQNPFKANGSIANSLKNKKKTPPPVPTKRSTLSIRKTVTQQLREREREKEKERERTKNEANNRKTNLTNGTALSSPEEFITTEEVLKQSKYVKTYIKNQDPVFVYDPTILARIKFEELREFIDKKPPKKLRLTNQTRERLKDLKNKPAVDGPSSKLPTFKKCSKPNYPELADIKVRVGTECDGSFFNPDEVSKNAKKFDERVKKLHIGSDDDLDEIDGPLTKSESSDEVTANHVNHNSSQKKPTEQVLAEHAVMNGDSVSKQPVEGTFTNTIKSKAFHEYLEKKGLTLIPKKIPNGAKPVYTNGELRPATQTAVTAPERVQISIDKMDASKNEKKPSVFQRLLANSIFASRRKTTPKETVPMPRNLYDSNRRYRDGDNAKSSTAMKRVVLERQSFHGRPRASNLLSSSDANDLKNQAERSRKSFAGGDDLSVSISSALTNAEYDDGTEYKQSNIFASELRKPELQPKPISKPPRRTLSRDRLGNPQQQIRQAEPQVGILKPKVQRFQVPNNIMYTLPVENHRSSDEQQPDGVYLRRTLERQSLIPKRTTQVQDKRQVFGRSASMDRNEILKRNAARGLQNKSKSANETAKVPTVFAKSKENLREELNIQNGPKQTSTPIRTGNDGAARQTFSPILASTAKPPGVVYVDQQEWERLKAVKERTDRELYYRVLQQQQHQRQGGAENIYEHLQPNQVIMPQPTRATSQQILQEGTFIRSSPQRNTFAGVIRNRQAKVIDGRTILAAEPLQSSQPANQTTSNKVADQQARSQSVLDGMTHVPRSNNQGRRGYESDTETPVVMRRRNESSENPPQRRIGGILTRDEILQKVREFCRKSLNKTPTNQPQIQVIYEKQPTDLSPVSYASVETHHRPGSRLYAAPQVPQRMQSLPQEFIPITHEIINEQSATTASPIYAHVVKRGSVQSNQSELYESPQRPYILRRESDAPSYYMARSGTLQRPESAFSPAQYVIVDGDKIAPAQVVGYHPAEIYAQPQYIRTHQMQPMPGAYGYITVMESMPPQQQQQQQQLRPRLHDGRSTPLILDRSSQQASQIYWTPQHQRLTQHAGLLPVQISPRYTVRQPYPVPAPARTDHPASRAAQYSATPIANIPINLQQQQQHQHPQQFSPMLRTNTPTQQQQQQQQTAVQQHQLPVNPVAKKMSSLDYNAHNSYEWESGSEAGEVQRIMEHQRNSGELKTSNIFKNLKSKMSRLVGSSKR